MTQQQLAKMLQHPDHRVRQYALRCAPELLASGEEHPRQEVNACFLRGWGVESGLRHDAGWYILAFPDGSATAGSRRLLHRACAVEIGEDLWYAWGPDLSQLIYIVL